MTEYISREAVTTLFARACGECREACEEFDGFYADCNECLLHGVLKEFAALPAADVRPVVRAHWYWDKDGMDWNIGAWRCSACHSRPETWWQGDSNSPRNKSGHYFCPNCGADMRETKEET